MSDRRSLFATPRVAHVSLEGRVPAQRFAEGTAQSVQVPVADLHADPETPHLDRQLLYGTDVTVLEIQGARSFLRDATMGFVGWVASAALGPPLMATHRVIVRSTLRFDAADFKAPAPMALPLGAQVSVREHEGRYAALSCGGYVMADHLAPLASPARDPVRMAEIHLGTPYLWGGNSAFGIDCSGLVQVALAACGRRCPGDSDQQARALGADLPEGTRPMRGDLMFWKGHVAWVADEMRLLHANAHHMAVAYEPIEAALARIAAQPEGALLRHARLADLSPDRLA